MLPGNAMSDSRVSKDDIKAESLIRIQNPIVKSFLAGSLSGTLSTLILQPLDLLKTRIQSSRSSPSQRGITLIFADIYRNHGVFGLWKGLTPSLARTVPGVGLYFCCLHNLQGQLKWSTLPASGNHVGRYIQKFCRSDFTSTYSNQNKI
ncbi:putative solute carrier family 25 member 38-B [Apostichopus japonicus]|uniref:Putative solute carrier family 25 member 38-B n=1 Tax=Stichopus japonicus TaxID=307972 RepID=A0A2G8JQT3_STIJA|nr:putative solute carrier family 25 member 38-B [Apostichopus japonicus]